MTEPGPAWTLQARRQRDAVLQPPKPDTIPASQILERAPGRQAGIEADFSKETFGNGDSDHRL